MLNKLIIIGGGLAGLSAAHTAIENGAEIILLEKSAFCGGNSSKATSGINGCDTKPQIKKGIKDSIENFEKDTILSSTLGKELKPYPLAKILTQNSSSAIEWLTSKFKLDLSEISLLGGHSCPRTHRGKNRFPGMTITYSLLEKLEEIEKNTNGQKAKIINNARAIKLLKDVKGNIIGVEYLQIKLNKKFKEFGIIVICTGGFSADFTNKDSLIKQYRPELAHLSTTNGSFATGDGMKMCREIGGELIDMENIQIHPTGFIQPSDPENKVKFLAAEALRGAGGIIIDSKGDRICNELGRRDYVSGEIFKNKAPFRLIINSKASEEINWHIKHYLGRLLMQFYSSGKEMAKVINIPHKKLEETFKEYSKEAEKGIDKFGKNIFCNADFDINDSFYIAEITPVLHYTMGGVRISPKCEVMLNEHIVIPGVFAAGEVTGGVHGKNRLGGNSLLECVVFGKIAGAEAANYLLNWNIEIGKKRNLMMKNKCGNFNSCFNSMKRIEIFRNQIKLSK